MVTPERFFPESADLPPMRDAPPAASCSPTADRLSYLDRQRRSYGNLGPNSRTRLGLGFMRWLLERKKADQPPHPSILRGSLERENGEGFDVERPPAPPSDGQ